MFISRIGWYNRTALLSFRSRTPLFSKCSKNYRKASTAITVPGPKKGDKVVVAMSGGVDSSVSARLLADQDYDLTAVFMRNWDTHDESGTDKGCEWEKDWEDVRRVCATIGLPCEMIDLSKDYWNRVFEPSLKLWEAGETPNPDVWCNREVKFGALIDRLVSTKNVQWLATGHYAGVDWHRDIDGRPTRPKLVRAVDRHKDQTYYLSGVTEASLRKALFPLQRLKKDEVRALARKYDLPTAERSESMGICFVGEKRRFTEFLQQYLPPKPGPIIDMTTQKRVGTHQGLWNYTIGQGARLPGMPQQMFVARKLAMSNEIFIVPGSTHPALFASAITTRNFKWIWKDDFPSTVDSAKGLQAKIQIRHRMADVPCTVRRSTNDELIVEFESPQLAVASGQIAALYDKDGQWCMGSGEIAEAQANHAL